MLLFGKPKDAVQQFFLLPGKIKRRFFIVLLSAPVFP